MTNKIVITITNDSDGSWTHTMSLVSEETVKKLMAYVISIEREAELKGAP